MNFSAKRAPPRAFTIEKHEQFTPILDVNLRRLLSFVLNLADSFGEKQGQSPGSYVLASILFIMRPMQL